MTLLWTAEREWLYIGPEAGSSRCRLRMGPRALRARVARHCATRAGRDETCPVSTGRGTRLIRLVRGRGGGGRGSCSQGPDLRALVGCSGGDAHAEDVVGLAQRQVLGPERCQQPKETSPSLVGLYKLTDPKVNPRPPGPGRAGQRVRGGAGMVWRRAGRGTGRFVMDAFIIINHS